MTTATPRSARIHSVEGAFDLITAPSGVQAGDMLVAIQTTIGPSEDMSISGGAGWALADERLDDEWFTTRVWTQVCGTSNPSTYAITQGEDASGLVALVHLRGATPTSMILVSDGSDMGAGPGTDVSAPDASPGAAGGIAIRYVLGGDLFGDPVSWSPDSSYTVEDENAHSVFASAFVGASTMLTSAALPEADFTVGSTSIQFWQTWTLVVVPGDYVPPPPPAPAFTPAKGSALYRYTAHDFLTGAYLDDIYPQDPVYDKRIGEPGSFSGTLPIPNSRVAAAARRIIPRLRSDLTTGPGRVQIRIWRDGQFRGRYWLTGAVLRRDRSGKISVQLRGTTFDGYFYSVRVRSDRSYSGDQVANVRSLLQHAQTQTGANIGLLFQSGSSGVSRALEIKADSNTSYGRGAAEYAKTSGGFEYTLVEEIGESGVESTWTWGYPKLTSDVVHVFSESPHGGDIAEWGLEMDALRGGTDWDVRGGTPEGDATEDRVPVYSTTVTTPHRAAGWPRIDRLIDHPTQSTDSGVLDDYAQYWADQAGGAVWVRSVTVYLGRHASLTHNSLGDLARFLMTNVWYERQDGGAGLDVSERIIGIAFRPPGKGRGVEEAQLILESEVIE
ncbi:hypothetical protein [Planomonospora venezuelensis]|uniref:Minor tail protein n=1 Tax=Planomonospora venezuelensis TaxID=1999 RepID=A0A841DA90_PLAVE|nr:hypothetical protein [Planomonospora venezuelensis]MBB5965045.1 hypothetical protein [Planomonospora venezuelensis]GIN05039.1 hypothetical protein Pve01_66970 [Planomonospora venezuelensis]